MSRVIDLDRYPELDPDDLPGPAPRRRRPGRVQWLVLAALALLAAVPAAPPRLITFARGTPAAKRCEAAVRQLVHIDPGSGAEAGPRTFVVEGPSCRSGDIGRITIVTVP